MMEYGKSFQISWHKKSAGSVEMTTEFEWDFFPQTPHTGQTGQALPSVVEILR